MSTPHSLAAPAEPITTDAPSRAPVRAREIFGWCCFDFANSAFTTVIITVIYARYFASEVAGGDPRAGGWWGSLLSFSQMIVIVLSPLLGAMADMTARKKAFLFGTAIVCSLATAALYLVGRGEIWSALALAGLAYVAFSLSENLCAAFLPEISTPETAGKISGYGWSFGYFGGLVSLGLTLLLVYEDRARAPLAFLMTAAFFLLASLPTLLLLRERATPRRLAPGETYLSIAFAQLRRMRRELPRHRVLARFFIAMTIYLSGLSAVIGFAALFAEAEIKMSDPAIIILFAVLQLAGAVGAFGFGLWQDRVGPKPPLVIALLLWMVACVWAAVCRTPAEFYGVGTLAGIALGSLQSASRAVVSTLTPPERSGEFFGYWGFFSKLAGVIGPAVFGWMATGFGYRTAILANAGFFLVGLLVLLPLRLRIAEAQAGSSTALASAEE